MTTSIQPLTLSRRQFITTALTAAGGFALGVGIAGPAEAASLGVRPWGDEAKRYPGEINAWVVIEPDDTVIIRYGRAEMGQGSFTALPQILTEELECDWAFVKPEYASANRNFRENKVYGSLSHRRQPRRARDRRDGPAGRRERARTPDRGGGEALGRSGLRMLRGDEQGRRTSRPAARSASASWRRMRPRSSSTRSRRSRRPDQYKFIGRRLARLDVPLKINGTAKYGIDLEVPDMVHAAIIKCPVFGGTVKSVDEAAIAGRRGVLQVVKLKDAVAVIADRYFRAQAALNALRIEWEVGAAGTDRQCAVPQGLSRGARPEGRGGSSRRQCRCRDADGRQGDRGDLRGADHRARTDGAAQRHRACAGGSRRRLGRHAERRPGADIRRAGLRREAARTSTSTTRSPAAASAGGSVPTKSPRRSRSPRRSASRSS